MADAIITVKQGEILPVIGTVTVLSPAALTVSGTPTWQLYDSSGAAVPGQSGNVTGSSTGALQTIQAWVLLDTTALPTPAWYTVTFTIQASGSDLMTKTYRPNVRVHVEEANL